MEKGKKKKRNSLSDIIKYSVISGTAGGACAALISIAASFFIENTDAPELYFEAVSWISVIFGSLLGGVVNGILENGREKYSGALSGMFAALMMLVISAAMGGMTDGVCTPLKAAVCIAASFFGGCTVSFSMSSSKPHHGRAG